MNLDNLRGENPFAPCQVCRGGRCDLLTLWAVILTRVSHHYSPSPPVVDFQNEQLRDAVKTVVSDKLGLQAQFFYLMVG